MRAHMCGSVFHLKRRFIVPKARGSRSHFRIAVCPLSTYHTRHMNLLTTFSRILISLLHVQSWKYRSFKKKMEGGGSDPRFRGVSVTGSGPVDPTHTASGTQ